MERSRIPTKSLLRAAAAVLSVCIAASLLCTGCARSGEDRRFAAAVKMADFILALQREDGAIPDSAEAGTVNEDSNMEYALTALAAAYQNTGEEKYLSGLERGISWLADAEVMENGPWKGSWWYLYDLSGSPLKTGKDGEAEGVRGVDATSALFVYLLFLDRKCTGNDTLAKRYRANAAAALDFVLTKSMTDDGFAASSFHLDEHGVWSRYECCYSADQGDVWLGLRAGALLYGDDDCAKAADLLKEKVPEIFFSADRHRYCTCIEDGRQDWSEDGFAPVQSQGFLPWMWGDTQQNREALAWLSKRMRGDLSEEFFLSAAFLLLGEQGTGTEPSAEARAWLLENGVDADSGGVYDSPRDSTETVNVAAFCALALFGSPAGV